MDKGGQDRGNWSLYVLGFCAAIAYATQIIAGMFVTSNDATFPTGWSANNTIANGTVTPNLAGAQADAMYQYTTFMGAAAVAVLTIWAIAKMSGKKGDKSKPVMRFIIAMVGNLAVMIGYYTVGYNSYSFTTFLGLRYGLVNAGGGLMFGAVMQFITSEIAEIVVRTPAPKQNQPLSNEFKHAIAKIKGPAIWNVVLAPLLALMFLFTMYDTVMGGVDGAQSAYLYIALAFVLSIVIILAVTLSLGSPFLSVPNDGKNPDTVEVNPLVAAFVLLAFACSRGAFYMPFVFIPAQMYGAGCDFYDMKIAVICLAVGMIFGGLIAKLTLGIQGDTCRNLFIIILGLAMFGAVAGGQGGLSTMDQYTCDPAMSKGLAFLLTFGLSYLCCWFTAVFSENMTFWTTWEFQFVVLAVFDAVGPIWALLVVEALTVDGSRNYADVWFYMLAFTGSSFVFALLTLIAMWAPINSCKRGVKWNGEWDNGYSQMRAKEKERRGSVTKPASAFEQGDTPSFYKKKSSLGDNSSNSSQGDSGWCW